MSDLQAYVDQPVCVVTYDGRTILGILKGFDQTTSLILAKAEERVITEDNCETVPLGLYIIRGPNIALVGEVDTERDSQIDWDQVRAAPLKTMKV
ncbi:hypothetical protein HDU76_012414 [Blyttiomyces sp. JEL0837]|nr:hypothetical protein HDU76_012414 [Blyttiomyces sp. JEL0837]